MSYYWYKIQQLEQEERKRKAKEAAEERMKLADSMADTAYRMKMQELQRELENKPWTDKYEAVLPYIIIHVMGDDVVICYDEELDEPINGCWAMGIGVLVKMSELETMDTFCGMNLALLKEIYDSFASTLYKNYNGIIIKFSYDDFLYFMREELKEYSEHIEFHGSFAYNY